jgi:proteic killer suppression protein
VGADEHSVNRVHSYVVHPDLLTSMDAATRLDDLREPPGNMLEPLRGKGRGQQSIRINDQFRICFVWKEDGAYDVEIVEYHRERKG